MKNLILLFTLIFAFGFSQTIEAQPVPEKVITETQPQKSKKGKTDKCKRTKRAKAQKVNMNHKKAKTKGKCCKGKKGKATSKNATCSKGQTKSKKAAAKSDCCKGKKYPKGVKATVPSRKAAVKKVNKKGKAEQCGTPARIKKFD